MKTKPAKTWTVETSSAHPNGVLLVRNYAITSDPFEIGREAIEEDRKMLAAGMVPVGHANIEHNSHGIHTASRWEMTSKSAVALGRLGYSN